MREEGCFILSGFKPYGEQCQLESKYIHINRDKTVYILCYMKNIQCHNVYKTIVTQSQNNVWKYSPPFCDIQHRSMHRKVVTRNE